MIECLSGAEAVARAPFIAGILARAFSDPAQRWSAQSVAESCGTPGTRALLAPHGCALIRIVADEAELLTIARDPIARGQGVGAELLEACIAEAGRAGAARLYLEVASGNAAAIRLYQSRGFRSDGRRARYYGGAEGEDALLMSCEVAPVS